MSARRTTVQPTQAWRDKLRCTYCNGQGERQTTPIGYEHRQWQICRECRGTGEQPEWMRKAVAP